MLFWAALKQDQKMFRYLLNWPGVNIQCKAGDGERLFEFLVSSPASSLRRESDRFEFPFLSIYMVHSEFKSTDKLYHISYSSLHFPQPKTGIETVLTLAKTPIQKLSIQNVFKSHSGIRNIPIHPPVHHLRTTMTTKNTRSTTNQMGDEANDEGVS